jgi:hypothetical protein
MATYNGRVKCNCLLCISPDETNAGAEACAFDRGRGTPSHLRAICIADFQVRTIDLYGSALRT